MHKPLILLALLPFALFAAEPTAIPLDQAPITHVDLHVGWADVHRTVTIPPGPARRVRLDMMEAWLIPETVRASGPSLVAASGTVVPSGKYDVPEHEKIKTAIEEKEFKVKNLKAELALLQKSSANLQKLIDWKTAPTKQVTETSARTLTTAEIDAVAKLNADIAENHKQSVILQKTIRETEDARTKDQEAFNSLIAEFPLNFGRIDLDLAASDAESTVSLQYQVTRATWYPIADAALTDDGLEIRYRAVVRQNSGADWSNISLTLSHGTAEPAWRKVYDAAAGVDAKKALTKSQAILANARAAGVPSIWLTIPKATVLNKAILASFEGPVAKPSITRRWVLNAQSGDRAAASLVLTNTDSIGYPNVELRPGPLTQTSLPAIPGGDSLTVSLYPDANLTVTRTPLPGSRVSLSGPKNNNLFLGGYRLTVHNAYDTARTIELYEPLGQRTFLGATPEAASAGKTLHWTLTIPPNSSKSVTWTYRQ